MKQRLMAVQFFGHLCEPHELRNTICKKLRRQHLFIQISGLHPSYFTSIYAIVLQVTKCVVHSLFFKRASF